MTGGTTIEPKPKAVENLLSTASYPAQLEVICLVKDDLQRLPWQTVLHDMAGAAQLRASGKSSC